MQYVSKHGEDEVVMFSLKLKSKNAYARVKPSYVKYDFLSLIVPNNSGEMEVRNSNYSKHENIEGDIQYESK